MKLATLFIVSSLLFILQAACYQAESREYQSDEAPEEVIVEAKTVKNKGKLFVPSFPSFDFPPPKGYLLARGSEYLPSIIEAEEISLGEIDQIISTALQENGYDDKSYFAVPEGFALVTRIEQINLDGRPKEDPDRWSIELTPLRKFHLRDYIRALRYAQVGHYRLIIFIVTPYSFSPASRGELELNEATEWFKEGANSLPLNIANRQLSSVDVNVLIYEFEKSHEGAMLAETPLTARKHMEGSGLLEALGE